LDYLNELYYDARIHEHRTLHIRYQILHISAQRFNLQGVY